MDSYERSDAGQRSLINSAFQGRRYKLYTALELFEEMLGILSSRRSDRLIQRVRWLLAIPDWRTLNDYRDIIRNELAGKQQIFLPASAQTKLYRKLKQIADGKLSTRLQFFASQTGFRKESDLQWYKDQQNVFRAEFPQLAHGGCIGMSLEEFHASYWNKWQISWVSGMLQTFGAENPSKRAAVILENPGSFPYLSTLMRVHSLLFYRYFVRNRRVKMGDLYDAAFIVYLTGLDLLITNDQGLLDQVHEVSGQGSMKAMTFENFVQQLQGSQGC
jgi:hypothetical protein